MNEKSFKADLDILKLKYLYEPDTGFLFKKDAYTGKAYGPPVGSEVKDDYLAFSATARRNSKRTLSVHRFVWFLVNGSWPVGQIDHIDGNRQNNRIENLREVTNANNHKNRRTTSRKTGGRVGVFKRKERPAWEVKIKTDSGLKHIGCFADYFEACCARAKADLIYGYGL